MFRNPSDPAPWTRSFCILALTAAALLAACSAVPADDYFLAGISKLDAGDRPGALVEFEQAAGAADDDGQRALALALMVETHIAAGDLDEAGDIGAVLRAQYPRCFTTWKAAAVLALRQGHPDEARDCLRAATRFANGLGRKLWIDDFSALLEALSAFHAGDLGGAVDLLRGIRHDDVVPGAAWLLGRIETVLEVQQQNKSEAQRQGIEDGLLDLLHVVDEAPVGRRLLQPVLRAHPAEARRLEAVAGAGSSPRQRYFTPNLPIAMSAAVASLAVGAVPMQVRER